MKMSYTQRTDLTKMPSMTISDPAESDPRIERTRTSAIEATLELVAESGIHACTFDAISERSGVARSTLYRHWKNQDDLVSEAIRCQNVERITIDTGSLRDDMLHTMLGLGRALERSIWGSLIPHMVAAGSNDPQIAEIQALHADYHHTIDEQIVERAQGRGEIPAELDSAHVALLFYAPIFYRYLQSHQPIDARWITKHVDNTIGLLAT